MKFKTRIESLGIGVTAAVGLLVCGCHSVVFTSDTKIGLDISENANQAPEAAFGYKRTAVVIMPVKGSNCLSSLDASSTNDCYSVLADIYVSWKWHWALFGNTNTNAGIRVSEIMATGMAARNLATNQTLGKTFGRTVLAIYTNRPGMTTPSK